MRYRGWNWHRRVVRTFRGMLPGYQAPASKLAGTPTGSYGTKRSNLVRLLGASLIVAMLLGFGAWWLLPRTDGEVHLRTQLAQALSKSDHQRAHVLVTRLVKTAPDNDEYLWWSASIDEQLSRHDSAAEIRNRLAHRSFGPAVLWKADQSYPLNRVTDWSEQDHKDFLVLLTENTPWPLPIGFEVHKRLAAYWTIQGEFKKAIESLNRICSTDPSAYVNLATLHLKLDDRVQAESNANLAKMALQVRIQDQPRDAEARLQLVRALTILGRESEAIAILAAGFELTRQPVMQQAAGEVLVSWARRMKDSEGAEATIWPRLQLIHRATQCAPQDRLVLTATLDLIAEFQSGESSRQDDLRHATAKGIERTAAHWMLGCLFALEDQQDRALQHLKLAVEKFPEMPTLLNNLALHLNEHGNSASERALSLINMAIALVPGEPRFFETRGRMLMALRRWEEAILDLNTGLAVDQLRPQIYQQLVRAHVELGDAEAASHYEKLRHETTQ